MSFKHKEDVKLLKIKLLGYDLEIGEFAQNTARFSLS